MSTYGGGTYGTLGGGVDGGSPRRIEKFTSADDLDVVTLDGMVGAWSTRQGLRGGAFYSAGQHYPTRTLGYAPGLLAAATEDIAIDPFGPPADVNDAVDDILATCHQIGLGKLWTIDDDDVRRWAWACLAQMPETEMGPFTLFNLPMRLTFDRYSYWLGETPVMGSQSIAAATETWDIENEGFGPAYGVTFTLISGGVNGFGETPTLTNARGPQSVAVDFDGATGDYRIRIRTDDVAVETSTNGGADYTDAYSLVALGDTQTGLIELHRGINPMTYEQSSGTPVASLEWSYYETFYR